MGRSSSRREVLGNIVSAGAGALLAGGKISAHAEILSKFAVLGGKSTIAAFEVRDDQDSVVELPMAAGGSSSTLVFRV